MVAIRQSATSATLPGAPLAGSLLAAFVVPDTSGGITDPPFGTVGTLQTDIPAVAPYTGNNSEAEYGDDGTGPGTLYLYDDCIYRFDMTVSHQHVAPATTSHTIKMTLQGTDIGVLDFGSVRLGTAVTFMTTTGAADRTSVDPEKISLTISYVPYVGTNGRTTNASVTVTYVSGPDPRYVGGPPAGAIVWPDGWTLQASDTDVNDEQLEVRTKVSAGAGDTTIDFSGGTTPLKVAYYELTDWASVSGAAAADYTNDGTPAIPSITPTEGRPALLIAGVSKHPGAGPQTLTGYTPGEGGTFGADGRLTTWYKTVATTSGSYSGTASDSGDASDDGIGAHLGIVGEAPAPPSNFQLCVTTPSGTPLVCFTGLVEKTIRAEFNGTGSGNFVIYRGHPQATEANLAQGNIVQVTIPEIHSGVLFEFIIEDGDFELISSDEEGGELLQFGGRGTLALLENARLGYENLTDPSREHPDEGVWRWESEEAAAIVRRLIDEAQAHTPPAIPDVTRDWTDTTDSDGNPFFDMDGIWEIEIGTDLLQAAMDLAQAGMIQFEMRPGQVLRAYDEQGFDRTGTAFAADVVRFVKAVNVSSELSRQMAAREWGSTVLLRTQNGYAWVPSGGGPSYVKELYLDLSNASGSSTGARAAARKLARGDDQQDALILEVPPYGRGAGPNDEANGWYYPGWDGTDHGKYWLGDSVTVHTGTADFDYDNVTFRVQAITLTVDETGELAPPVVELASPWETEPDKTRTSEADRTTSDSGGDTKVAPHVHSQYQVANVDKWKQPVRVATTANITISTGLNPGDTIDGVTLAENDRVLVKNQSTQTQNGIYLVAATPIRAYDFDGATEIAGSIVGVLAGTTNAGTAWRCENATAPAIGSDNITFVAFGTGGAVTYATTADIADVAATENAGAATTVPRGDHVHRLGITTTRGDLIRRGASDNERVALGASGKILTSDGTDAVWGNGPLTTRGDLITGGVSGAIQRLALGADGRRLGSDGTDAVWLEEFRLIQGWLDGGGSALTTGLKVWTSPLPWDAVPVAWYLDGDVDGAAVVDVGKGTTWAGSAFSSMCASDKPTLTSTGGTDLTATGSCTGWSTISAGDRLSFNIDSVTSYTKLMVGIKLRLTS